MSGRRLPITTAMTLVLTAAPPAARPAEAVRPPLGMEAVVDRLPGFRTLHGRCLPDGRTVAHVAVGPSGMWLVEGRRWEGARLRAESGTKLGRPPRLLAGSTDHGPLVADLVERADVLTRLVGEELFWMPGRAALCVAGACWSRLGRGLSVDGVRVCWPATLGKVLGGRQMLGPDEVFRVHARLAELLA